MFPADDVMDLMRETGAIFMHQAVFALPLCGTLANGDGLSESDTLKT